MGAIHRPLHLGLLLLAIACGGGDGGGGPAPAGPILAKSPTFSGDGQSGPVAQPLADSFRVVVTTGPDPAAGVSVSWAAFSSGAVISPSAAVTDAQGRAAASMTLGPRSGPQSARAAINGSSVTFSVTANPGFPTQLIVLSGQDQAALTSTPLAAPLRVQVSDQFGNVIPGTPVTWSVASGSASVSPGTSITAGDGVATATVLAGSVAGTIAIRAVSAEDTAQFTAFGVNLVRDILVRNNFFESVRNGTQAPAIDTIPAGEAVRWIWQSAAVDHNVLSQGTERFPGSPIRQSPFSFGPIGISTPGTYHYECSLHTGMSGVIVVQ